MSKNEKKEGSEYFRLCDGASDFISKIKDNPESAKFGTAMELYWLCLLLGISLLKEDNTMPNRPPAGTEKSTDWTGLTRQYQEGIRAFAMYGYLTNLGFEDVNREKAETIEESIDEFLQSSGSKLTNRGVKEADKLAQKGWDHVVNKKMNRVSDLGAFLIKYVEEIEKIGE